MARYQHYMTKAAGGKWPGRVLIVGCVGIHTPANADGTQLNETLVSWHALSLELSHGSYLHRGIFSDTDISQLWKWLYYATDFGGNSLVLSYRCNRVWSLLNLWEALENGQVSLKGKDERCNNVASVSVQEMRRHMANPIGGVSATTLSNMRSRETGYIVLEDPPCIARLRCKGSKGQFTWIDIRNWGMDIPDGVQSGNDEIVAIRSAFQGMHEASIRCPIGSLKTTSGAQALHTFRYGFLDTGIYVHQNQAALKLEGQAYYGGRCECFRMGDCGQQCYHLDFRSMYPYICNIQPVPVRLQRMYDGPSIDSLMLALGDFGVIACVEVETPLPCYPLQRGSEVVWPVGRFTTSLAGPELYRAICHNDIRKVISMSTYDLEKALNTYATIMYDLRHAMMIRKNRMLEQWAKSLLVCLPGKFGQRYRRWVDTDDEIATAPYGEWIGKDNAGLPCRYRSIAWHVQRDEQAEWSDEACPAIAAYITSAARMRLLHAIEIAGWDQVYYCDTDSVICSQIGYIRLQNAGMVQENRMGMLQLKAGPISVETRGIKHYVQGGKIVCSGQPKGVSVQTADGLGYWYTDYPASQARDGHRPQASMRLHKYVRESSYKHGTVMSDGRILPPCIME